MTLRFPAALVLLLVLAVLAPLAVAADVCEECVSGEAGGCCLPACGACVCCAHAAAVPDARRPAVPGGAAGPAWHQAAARPSASSPRAVFHVPKRTS